MKTFISLLILLSVPSSWACTDFSGLYDIQGSSLKTHIKIVQENCSYIEFTYISVESGEENRVKFSTDGRLQPSIAESEYIYLIHRGKYLEWNTINLETDEVVQGKDHLNADGDIFTEMYRTYGDGSSTTQFAALRRLSDKKLKK